MSQFPKSISSNTRTQVSTPTSPPVNRVSSASNPPATPSTPQGQAYQTGTPTGTWRHPRFDEITRRQNAANFDESNFKKVVVNGGLLLFSFVAKGILASLVVPWSQSYVLFTMLTSLEEADV